MYSTFQVEVLTQFLMDLEWQWHQRGRSTSLNGFPPCMLSCIEWLRKIIQLMQLERTSEESSQRIDVDHVERRWNSWIDMSP